MRTWWMAFLLVIAACLWQPADTEAAYTVSSDVRLYVNGQKLEPEVGPRIVDGNTLAPVRAIAEHLGAEVAWDPDNRKVDIFMPDNKITMHIDRQAVSVNGIMEELEVPPLIFDGSTMVPVRFVAERFGMMVLWDDWTRTVSLVDKAIPPSPTPTPSPKPSATPTPSASSKPSATPKPTDSGKPSASPTPTASGKPSATPKPSGSPSPSPSASVPPEKNGVYAIELKGDKLTVSAGDAPMKPSILYLSDPGRIVIDLPGNQLAIAVNGKKLGLSGEFAVESDWVSQIRYSRFSQDPAQVRIVLDMKKPGVKLKKEQADSGKAVFTLYEPNYKIVIDPGHGGKDPGTSSDRLGLKEKEFNLSVANKVSKLLSADKRIELIMTRDDDTYPTLEERIELANSEQADLFVSIHANAYNGKTHGTETYYYTEQSAALAKTMHKHLIAATGFVDRGVRTNSFKVIRYTTMPSVLLEVGYLDHPENDAKLADDAFRTKVAEGIVKGIREYLGLE